jgi:hypothetical protein
MKNRRMNRMDFFSPNSVTDKLESLKLLQFVVDSRFLFLLLKIRILFIYIFFIFYFIYNKTTNLLYDVHVVWPVSLAVGDLSGGRDVESVHLHTIIHGHFETWVVCRCTTPTVQHAMGLMVL